MIHLKSYWPRYISLDWGFSHFSAVYWFATDGDNVYCYRERVVNHKTAPELADVIIEATPEHERKSVKTLYAGPDIFSRKTSDRTISIEMDSCLAPHGFGFTGVSPAAAGPGDRKLGWALVYQLLKSGRLKISPDCRELIKAIPQAIRDFPNHAEDVKKVDTVGDDCLDSFRYGLYTSSLTPRLPIELEAAGLVKVDFKENPIAHYYQTKDALADVRRRRGGMSFGR